MPSSAISAPTSARPARSAIAARCLRIFIICVAASVVLNILIAWALVVWNGRTSWRVAPIPIHAGTGGYAWPIAVPPTWPARCDSFGIRVRAGFQTHEYQAILPAEAGETHGAVGLSISTAGFPFPALKKQSNTWWPTVGSFPELTGLASVWRDGIDFTAWAKPGVFQDYARLPVRAMPAGFAANTLLYSLVLYFTAGGGIRDLRSWHRESRGLCRACAYPVGVSAVCTECGISLPQRAATP